MVHTQAPSTRHWLAHHLHIFSVFPVLGSLLGPLDPRWIFHVPTQHWQPPTQQQCHASEDPKPLPSPLLDPPDPQTPSNFLFCTIKYFLSSTLLVFLPSVSVIVSRSLLLSAPLTNGPVSGCPHMSLYILSFPPCWSHTLVQPASIAAHQTRRDVWCALCVVKENTVCFPTQCTSSNWQQALNPH